MLAVRADGLFLPQRRERGTSAVCKRTAGNAAWRIETERFSFGPGGTTVCRMGEGAELDAVDPHREIARLEGEIEQLAAKIENCRKFTLASRTAIAVGAIVLLAVVFGAIRFDAVVMGAAVAALLGGIVLLGSNRSTAKEAAAQLAAAEASRAALIDRIDLRVVGGRNGGS